MTRQGATQDSPDDRQGESGGIAPAREFQDQLELLAFVSRAFADALDIEATLKLTLEHITRHMDAEGGALFLLDPSGATLRCEACVGPTDITGLTLNSHDGIVGRSVQGNRGEIIRDTSQDEQFLKSVDEKTGFYTRSILCAPMTVQDERIGAIELVNRRGGDGLFSEADLNTLQALSASAGLAILNARRAEALVGQERLKRELELAAEIQRSLLPDDDDAGFPVAGLNYPARVVSGDFFDFFPLPDGRICFNLGDVSGKGMNAALLMAKTASLFRCLGKDIHEPGRLMARVNDEICETAARGMFVTMVGGIYDPATGIVRLANAGHEPPLLHEGNGKFRAIPAEAPPLGIVGGGGPIPETEINIGSGALYVFTDGVTEGYVADGSELEVDGVKSLIVDHEGLAPTDRLGRVLAPVHREGVALRDDLTMLVVDGGAGSVYARGRAVSSPPRTPPTGTFEATQLLGRLSVPARADRLKVIRAFVAEALRASANEKDIQDVVLAIDEACQNIIRHAYGGADNGPIDVELYHWGDASASDGGGTVTVLLRDYAPVIDPTQVRPRDLNDVRPGGLGTHFIAEVMDNVEFLPPPEGGGNLLRMVKQITKKDSPA